MVNPGEDYIWNGQLVRIVDPTDWRLNKCKTRVKAAYKDQLALVVIMTGQLVFVNINELKAKW